METTLAKRQTSRNITLSNALDGIRSQLEHAAEQNLSEYLRNNGDDYTHMEKRSMMMVEQLKLVNGLDLAAVYFRGELVRQIRDEALWTVHPNRYTSLEHMAREQGISVSELSQTITLCEVIFPWLEEHAMSVAVIWEEVGKSNFREMTPALRALITGEVPGTTSTQNTVETLLNDAAATALASGLDLTDEEIHEQAIHNLIQAGQQMTAADMRTHLRPNRTMPIDFTIVRFNGQRFLIGAADEDQWTMFQNKMGRYMEPVVVNLPANPSQRAIEASRVRVIRDIANLVLE